MIYFGIDPGKSGAVAAIWDDGVPVSQCQSLDATEQDIANYFLQFDLTRCAAVIERVNSMPKNGHRQAFIFGQSYGFMRGLLAALKIPFTDDPPKRWQKVMDCMTGGNKNVSKQKAQQLWPTLKITHRNADALLIAEYARTKGK